jgi:O-antigen ligase
MAGLILDIAKRIAISFVIVMVVGRSFGDLLALGESNFQTIVVLSFYVYCVLSLFLYSRHKLFHVLSIPILTQFLHLFQKYSFPAGANSWWRLLPFIILNLYFGHFLLQKRPTLSFKENLFLMSWLILQTFFLLISPNLANIAIGGFLLFNVTLPMYFLYLKTASKAVDFAQEVEKYLCLLYTILGLGTFGLVIAGSGYKGSDNLLATRNISDTNVTMAYFILLWPFVLLFCNRNRLSSVFTLAFFSIFIGVVIFSFSRGAVIIIIPYLLISLALIKNLPRFIWTILLVVIAAMYFPAGFLAFEHEDLSYFWQLRFGNSMSIASALAKLHETSGRAQIHSIAYDLFLQNPLIGHGTGSFEVLGPGYREAHSIFYTLLAEQGMVGVLYMYLLFAMFAAALYSSVQRGKEYGLLLLGFTFYLLFNHTVGSVFVIIPAKSVTINCIAPILLLCLYFYAESLRTPDNMTSPTNA